MGRLLDIFGHPLDGGPPLMQMNYAAGVALCAWLATVKMLADQLKRVIALVLLTVALKTDWGLL